MRHASAADADASDVLAHGRHCACVEPYCAGSKGSVDVGVQLTMPENSKQAQANAKKVKVPVTDPYPMGHPMRFYVPIVAIISTVRAIIRTAYCDCKTEKVGTSGAGPPRHRLARQTVRVSVNSTGQAPGRVLTVPTPALRRCTERSCRPVVLVG